MPPLAPLVFISQVVPAATAALPCPPAAPPAGAIGGDGTAWVIARDEVRACLIAVDEDGETSLVTRWSLRGQQAPVALAALADGRAVLVRPEGQRWRLSTWDRRGIETALPIWVPAAPDIVIAHPERALIALRMPRPDIGTRRQHARIWLVDVDAGAVAALGSVDPDATPAFQSDATVLRVGDIDLVAPGAVTGSHDEAPYPGPLE